MKRKEYNNFNEDIYKSLNYIKENISNKITLDEICNYLNLSKYHFCRIFKKQMGTTPYNYILNCKMEKVKTDLNDGIDINTIVNNYNFYDVSHLNKCFSKIYGITPLEYRKIGKECNENKYKFI